METATLERPEQTEEMVTPVEPTAQAMDSEAQPRIDRDPPLHLAETAMRAMRAYEENPLPPIDQKTVLHTRDLVQASGGRSTEKKSLRLGRIPLLSHRGVRKEIKLASESSHDSQLPALGIGRTITAMRRMKRAKDISPRGSLRRSA